jgi:hypothetical protein
MAGYAGPYRLTAGLAAPDRRRSPYPHLAAFMPFGHKKGCISSLIFISVLFVPHHMKFIHDHQWPSGSFITEKASSRQPFAGPEPVEPFFISGMHFNTAPIQANQLAVVTHFHTKISKSLRNLCSCHVECP